MSYNDDNNMDYDPFDNMDFRTINVNTQRLDLLEQRRKVLNGTDPKLQVEIAKIKEQLNERNLILNAQMDAEYKWISTRCKQESEQLETDETSELSNVITKLSDELDSLKQSLEDYVHKMDLFDRKTLQVFESVCQELNVDDKMDGDYTQDNPLSLLEKRSVMPGRLISDAAIKEDLIHLNQSFVTTEVDTPEVPKLMRPRHKVVMDKARLIYDGKTFYRGQKLFVQTMNYTKFPAIVFALADEYVHIRSRTPGDTREVFATIDDLRAGRVRIGRKVVTSP
ncbi:unnamed protein product [Bursaphelenchus xylophilus]|uniref:(pine wood nematode) hypothetical protein n=1 Tax=Bursaphelenchus xylophilus TaxID=6326 RepID=A0A1I7S333_BURXY|nr:unnamed protein product [Bursaphelenchus xylophilus]CAG9116080.1 unnamed protein product [Bursaphelenchus xylophilus]